MRKFKLNIGKHFSGRKALIRGDRKLLTTLYAMRLFFLSIASPTGVKLEPINRNQARLVVEKCLRELRSIDELREYEKLQAMYRQMFLR